MPVTAQDVALIRSGFDLMRDRIVPASVEFYEALFRRRPDLRAMFREDLAGQGMKFMSTLEAIVDSLADAETMDPRIEELGHTHAALGVKVEDFVPMADALFEVLGANLGEAFTPEAEAAWRRAYDELAGMMISGGIVG